jgi:hypothetical protein
MLPAIAVVLFTDGRVDRFVVKPEQVPVLSIDLAAGVFPRRDLVDEVLGASSHPVECRNWRRTK